MDSLLQFPCSFPIKIMGVNADGFAQAISETVRIHVPEYDPSEMSMRPSTGNKYLSLTVTVDVESQEQLDALYQSLTKHPMVKFVL